MIFQKVLFRIPTGTVLGETRVGMKVVEEMRWSRPSNATSEFNVAVTDAFRELGYVMRDSADALFDPAKQLKVRYELAAIVHSAKLDFQYPQRTKRGLRVGVGMADVEVEVQLNDAVKERVVYSRRFEGHGEDEGVEPNPIVAAIVQAILRATTDPEFVRLLGKDDVAATGESAGADAAATPITVCRPVSPRTLPDALDAALESIVELRVGSSVGTGTLISPDGWILTADHVISDADEIWVRLANGIQLPGSVHSRLVALDVALVKIEGRAYPCSLPRRETADLRLGSEVFAINVALGEDGNPTVSRGVVAGFPESDGRRFVQTDASINPGSSGGPLLSADGRIVGITVAKAVALGFEGLGFAIPIDDALKRLGVRFTR